MPPSLTHSSMCFLSMSSGTRTTLWHYTYKYVISIRSSRRDDIQFKTAICNVLNFNMYEYFLDFRFLVFFFWNLCVNVIWLILSTIRFDNKSHTISYKSHTGVYSVRRFQMYEEIHEFTHLVLNIVLVAWLWLDCVPG